MQGNPEYGSRMQLFSETGYNLTIRSSGEVLGTQDDADPGSGLEITSAGEQSRVRIRGLQSKLYLAFDTDGNLYGEQNPDNPATIFEEHFQGSYNGYLSAVNPNWFVGIKKSGAAKNANRTGFGQKAVKFLPRRTNFQ